jgi:hypothetical protein
VKKLILLFVNLLLFSCFTSAQKVYFPKVKGDSLIYKIDTAKNDVLKTALYDTYNLRLLKWDKGFWYAEVTLMPGYTDTHVFISDRFFVKTHEYREALEKYSKAAKAENMSYLTALRKKYGKKFGDAIYNEYAEIGMTSSILRKALGSPKEINTTRTANSISEQWIYYEVFGKEQSDNKYYYLLNGRLVTIQD